MVLDSGKAETSPLTEVPRWNRDVSLQQWATDQTIHTKLAPAAGAAEHPPLSRILSLLQVGFKCIFCVFFIIQITCCSCSLAPSQLYRVCFDAFWFFWRHVTRNSKKNCETRQDNSYKSRRTNPRPTAKSTRGAVSVSGGGTIMCWQTGRWQAFSFWALRQLVRWYAQRRASAMNKTLFWKSRVSPRALKGFPHSIKQFSEANQIHLKCQGANLPIALQDLAPIWTCVLCYRAGPEEERKPIIMHIRNGYWLTDCRGLGSVSAHHVDFQAVWSAVGPSAPFALRIHH